MWRIWAISKVTEPVDEWNGRFAATRPTSTKPDHARGNPKLAFEVTRVAELDAKVLTWIFRPYSQTLDSSAL
jgi:hypothetical protein